MESVLHPKFMGKLNYLYRQASDPVSFTYFNSVIQKSLDWERIDIWGILKSRVPTYKPLLILVFQHTLRVQDQSSLLTYYPTYLEVYGLGHEH